MPQRELGNYYREGFSLCVCTFVCTTVFKTLYKLFRVLNTFKPWNPHKINKKSGKPLV